MDDPLDYLRLPAHTALFLEGDVGECAYLIKSGEVEVFVERGEQSFVLARRVAGELIGEMALIDHGTRSASVRTVSACEFIVITAQQIQHRIAQTDPILRMCLDVVIDRYRQTLGLYASGVTAKTGAGAGERSASPDFQRAIEVLTFEREIEHGIRNEEFELFFQPIINLRTYGLAGFEALIRWNHPARGFLPPGDFIAFAEASGLITGITKWCLRDVARVFPLLSAKVRQALSGRRVGIAGRDDLFISANVSGHDLLDPSFDRMVMSILEEGGVPSHALKLEITESVLMKDPEQAGRILMACRRHGMGVAIDDFGTGYSSLSHLSTLPITALKIDRSFVASIAEDGPSRKIVRTIRHLAGELDIPVIVEGIETEAQAAALVAMNCEYGQGYLFARPLPLDRTLDFIGQWRAGKRPIFSPDITSKGFVPDSNPKSDPMTKPTLIPALAICTAALACLIGTGGLAEAAPATVGSVEKAQGSAQAIQAGAARDLAVAGPVLFADKLRTGADSRLEAKLADGTVLTLGEKGKMTVDKFVYDPDRAGGKLALSVPNGAFLFVGGKIEGPTGGNVSIKTPVGTLGVRGTTVWGGHIDGGFGVLVLSGQVSVTTPRGTVMLEKGQGTMVYGAKGPMAAGAWPEDRVKRAVASISFAKATASADAPTVLGNPNLVQAFFGEFGSVQR